MTDSIKALESPGKCPKCGSTDITSGDIENKGKLGGSITVIETCNTCGEKWNITIVS